MKNFVNKIKYTYFYVKGEAALSRKEYDIALSYFELCEHLLEKTNIKNSLKIILSILLAECHLKTGDIDEYEKNIKNVENFIKLDEFYNQKEITYLKTYIYCLDDRKNKIDLSSFGDGFCSSNNSISNFLQKRLPIKFIGP